MAVSRSNQSRSEEVSSRSRTSQNIESDLPAHLVKDLTEAFRMFDLNGDGKISKVELGTVLNSLGESLTDAELEQMIRYVDADGDGEIDLQEFINLNTDSIDMERVTSSRDGADDLMASSSVKDALLSAFNVFDSDKDGFVSAKELHRVLSSLGDHHVSIEDCRYMISCVDIDGDEMVDFKEFQSLMTGRVVHK